MSEKQEKHIEIAAGVIAFLWLFLLWKPTHTQSLDDAQPETSKVTVKPHRTRRTSTITQPSRFQDTEFYRTIIDNNLFRPLGWRLPRPREPYRLLGTILPADRNTVSPQAIIQATLGNTIHIITIGEKLDANTKVTDIQPK